MAAAPPRLRVRLTPELHAKLSDMAAQRGVSAQVLAEAFVASGATGINAAPSKDRPIGRPVQNDLPPEVERSPITSGFTGIYPRGSRWLARWLHEELGMFSNPELAAIARYWFEQGRRSVARDSLIATGTPRTEAVQLTRFKGGGEPAALVASTIVGVGDSAAVGEVPVAPRRRGRPRKEPVPCCGHPVERHAYNGCADCGCNVRWKEHPDRAGDVTPEGVQANARAARAALAKAVGVPREFVAIDGDQVTTYAAPRIGFVERPEPLGANGGGPSDTTYDEPPEVSTTPGGEAPVPSPRSLRWSEKFRQPQPRMVAHDPPPPKPGSDPEES